MAREPAWTADATARLWDHYSSRPDGEVAYFARLQGDSFLAFAEQYRILHGDVLDYGAGPGYLTKKLVDRGLTTTAVEFTDAACARVREHVGPNPRLKDVIKIDRLPSTLADSSFDLVICSEVIEHLTDDWLKDTLAELRRLTRPGGHVLLSTPLEESLRQGFVYCPFCDAAFHRWQHLRSFSAESLRKEVADAGLDVMVSRGLDLERFVAPPTLRPLRHLSFDRFSDWCHVRLYRFLDAVLPGVPRRTANFLCEHGPRLVCVARKTT